MHGSVEFDVLGTTDGDVVVVGVVGGVGFAMQVKFASGEEFAGQADTHYPVRST